MLYIYTYFIQIQINQQHACIFKYLNFAERDNEKQ